MKQLGFFIDASKCTGCKTCTVACKDAHDSPVGINFRHVLEYAGGGWRQDRSTGAWHQDVFAYYLDRVQPLRGPCLREGLPHEGPLQEEGRRPSSSSMRRSASVAGCARRRARTRAAAESGLRKMTKCDGCLDRLSAASVPSASKAARSARSSSATSRNSGSATATCRDRASARRLK